MQISIKSDLDKMAAALSCFDDRGRSFLTMNTLNNVAFAALKKLREETPRFIDRPKPFTVNSSRVYKATRDKLYSGVDYKSGLGYNPGATAGDYLKPITFGGQRNQKRFESALARAGLIPSGYLAMPASGTELDQYGNVRGGVYTKILTYLRANPDALQNRRIQKFKKQGFGTFTKSFVKGAMKGQEPLRAKEEKARGRGPGYVVLMKGRNGWTGPSGVYERSGTRGGSRNSSTRMIFALVPSATYKAQFPFEKILSDASREAFPTAFGEAVKRELEKRVKSIARSVG